MPNSQDNLADPPRSTRIADGATILLLVGFLVVFILAASWNGPNSEHLALKALAIIGSSLMLVAVWGMAAAGFGAWALRSLPRTLTEGTGPVTRLLSALGLGVPLLLWITSGLGTMGGLDQVTGWGILIVGLIALGLAIRTSTHWQSLGTSAGWLPNLSWTAAPALAILFLATTSAPGWLWQTEFGGYDVLSYHLQLPREWMAAGRIFTPTHNVYGALPSFLEAGFLHLMVLDGNPITAAYSAQLLHASLALLTGLTTAAALGRWLGPGRTGPAFALLIGTPWVIVVGSLAYDEMGAALMLATGMLLLVPRDDEPELTTTSERVRVGFATGILAGGAVAMKLTASGLIALPLVYLMIRRVRNKGWVDAIPAGAIAGFLILLPWLVRNYIETGNPVFPFLAPIFGNGHYTAEQLARFMGAHTSTESFVGRVGLFIDQILRFGIGANPTPGEPWLPQWSLLPLLAFIGLVVGLIRPSTRRITRDLLILTVIPCVFWLAATHLKSRFLVPAIPAFIGAACLLVPPRLDEGIRSSKGLRCLLGVLLTAWCLLPVWLYWNERSIDGAPAASAMIGRLDLMTGMTPAAAVREQTDQEAMAELITAGGPNTLLAIAPENERILSLGNATPYLAPRRFTYTTVWDLHPLSSLIDAHPDDPAAVVAALRERGYTLLLVHRGMLENWSRNGWLDPNLGPIKVGPILERLVPEFAWPNGEILFRIPGDPPASSAEVLDSTTGEDILKLPDGPFRQPEGP